MSACELHSSCTQVEDEFPELPTRLLVLGKHKVSLQDTGGKRGVYATLSHCWGTSQVLTTTHENLAQRYLGIRWDSLPRIFQDAIALTRNLGIEYLWIDSLCIIQGDKKDWTHESARMASIYSNSYLNIAATLSSGSDGTLFTKRWTTPVPYEHDLETLPKRPLKSYRIPFASDETVIKARYSTRPAHENIKTLHDSRQIKRSDVFQKGPLLTRSWVFQERLLSPRTIHFHATEMVWECTDSFCCECSILAAEDPGMYEGALAIGKRWLWELETDTGYSPNNAWLDCIELYSRLRITKCTDKLPALAGLASRFALITQSRYLAGLWQCDLPRSLCWKVIGEEKDGPQTESKMMYGKRCSPYCAPTWSWASIDLAATGIVSSFEARASFEHIIKLEDSFEVDERYEIIIAECSTDPESPFGQVTSGMLKIRVAAVSTILFIDDSKPDFVIMLSGKKYEVDIDLNAEDLNLQRSISNYPVEILPQHREMKVLLAILGLSSRRIVPSKTKRRKRRKSSFALVLTLVEGAQARCERVGIVELDASEPDLIAADISTIEIV